MRTNRLQGVRRLSALASVVGIAVACSPRDDAPPSRSVREFERPGASASAPATASVPDDGDAPADRRSETLTGGDPERSLDTRADSSEVSDPGRREPGGRRARPIEIVLRSTPAGAVASVDGVVVGPTPTLWQGVADGRAREFTFVLPGYGLATYRFTPLQGGVVHGTLDPLKDEDPDTRPKR